jgi:hypothetical protein
VGTGKTLTPDGYVVDGNHGDNYAVTFLNDTTGEITAAAVTVTADPKSQVYGDAAKALTYQVTAGSLAGDDDFTGALDREPGSNVGTYAINQGTLGLSSDYALTFVGDSYEITARPITVTAVHDSKVYDATTDSDKTPTITSGTLAGTDSAAFTQSFGSAHVGTGKTLTPDGYVVDGNHGDNYAVTFLNDTTGEITAAATGVSADAASSTYSEQSVTVTLNATVANNSNAADLDGGSVTFQVKDGPTSVGSAVTDSSVVSGAASVSYVLPAGTAVGQYTVVATYSGTGNFDGSLDNSKKLTVGKRTTSTTTAAVSNPTYSSTATNLHLSATVSSVGSTVNAGSVTFQVKKFDGTANGLPVAAGVSSTVTNGAASATVTLPAGSVGPYTVVATFSGTGNFDGSADTQGFSVVYGWNGYLQPVNDTAHQVGVTESKFKLGQTIPLKFDLTDANGVSVQQSGSPAFAKSANRGACDANAAVDSVPTVAADTAAVYGYTGGHYQYNWSTKGLTAGEYKVFANLADGTNQYTYICLTK